MILAFDTSTSTMAVAIVQDNTVICEHAQVVERNHSVSLVPAIHNMLEKAGTDVASLRAIAVGQGPGSYTGVRIAVTTAKTLAWSQGLPLVGISTLETLAAVCADQMQGHAGDATPVERTADTASSQNSISRTWIIPLINARRGNAYCALFEWSEDGLKRLEPDLKRPLAEWMQQLVRSTDERHQFVFCGETAPFAFDPDVAGAHQAKWDVRELPVRAQFTGRLAANRLETAAIGPSVHAFVPDYTQPAEVEAKFMNKESGLDGTTLFSCDVSGRHRADL